jgi:hypothetical protein
MNKFFNKIANFFKVKHNPYRNFKTTKITFEQLMNSKKHIEDEIARNEDRIFNSMTTLRKVKKDGIDIFVSLFKRNELLMEQLNIVKDVQSEVNSTKTITFEGTMKKVYYFIYEIMNMSRRKEFLTNVKKQLAKLGVTPDEFSTPTEEYDTLDKKVTEYNLLLSKFNKETFVKVPLVPNLTLEYLT